MNRVLPLLLAALALALFVSVPALVADDKPGEKLASHEGKVVSATGNTLVMTADGKEHTHTLAADARIMVDGKAAQLSDLKPGMRIRVTTPKDNAKMAVRVDALDKNKQFERREAR